MVDVTEILQHWYAGRPKVEVARSLGVDAKTVRRYVAPAEAAGMAPGGPPVSEEQWRALARQWFPQLAGTGIRQVSWREIAVHHDRIAGLLPVVPVSVIHQRLADEQGLEASVASDALLAITQKAGQFRGESRFTTWAYRFVIFEVSAKIGRHFWRHPTRPLDAGSWDRLPGRFGFDPARESEWRDLLAALRRAVDTGLTPRQREVFVAVALNDVPPDALAIKLGSNRNALYKMMFDARRKLRAALVANGYLHDEELRRS